MSVAPVLMVQGTASSVGKSLMVTALCRLFAREGLRVAPFKAQNMALNAAVTADGLEMGRAQAVQAEAAGCPLDVAMNPVLLKPEGEQCSQVVVLGKVMGRMSASTYHGFKPQLRDVIADALGSLRRRFDLVIAEGAGSPAEVNLRDHDIVNMFVAKLARAPVLLVGDIDRGGVFASLVGTLDLLLPEEREHVAALVINKFRGDPALLTSGLEFITQRTGKPILGVLPYLPGLRLADEDSCALPQRPSLPGPSHHLDIVIIRLPCMSNHDDVEPLEHEERVRVRFVDTAHSIERADLVIVPGSKSTARDLLWLREQRLDAALQRRALAGQPILGLCGGCQMLGTSLHDPEAVESPHHVLPGLGLLPITTHFGRTKICAQVRASAGAPSFLSEALAPPGEITAYEIHMGAVIPAPGAQRAFHISSRNTVECAVEDGAVSLNGTVVGTMLHGLFDNTDVRAGLLRYLWQRRGLEAPPPAVAIPSRQLSYDRLADALRQHMDMDLLWRISQTPRRP